MNKTIVAALLAACASAWAHGQTDVSLFLRSDSVQRAVIDTTADDLYKKVGHHGPAVENSYMAVRLYFKAGCALDVYSKTRPGLELRKYGWYPTELEIAGGAGCDEYRVGKTPGPGGFALLDGDEVVPLTSTRGRRAEVGTTKEGAYASMLLRGVRYQGGEVDILVRVTMSNTSRVATVSAECVQGGPVVFVSGLNYHPGQRLEIGRGRLAAWGVHPADVVKDPLPIGAGVVYDERNWAGVTLDNALGHAMIRSTKPVKKASVLVVVGCSREDKLNTPKRFFDFVDDLQATL